MTLNTFEQINEAALELAENAISNSSVVLASALGLDERSGYRLYVGEDFIAVEKERDGSLQYYGGFEYEKEYRIELGGYAFYSSESDRVRGCMDRLDNLHAQEDANEEMGDL